MPQSMAVCRNHICYARRQGYIARIRTDAAGRAACLLLQAA